MARGAEGGRQAHQRGDGGAVSDALDREQAGARAAALMQHPAFSAAVEAVREAYVSGFRASTTQDEAWQWRMRDQALSDVLQRLQAVIMDGEAQKDDEPEMSPAEAILAG